jgi:hypothetical protein
MAILAGTTSSLRAATTAVATIVVPRAVTIVAGTTIVAGMTIARRAAMIVAIVMTIAGIMMIARRVVRAGMAKVAPAVRIVHIATGASAPADIAAIAEIDRPVATATIAVGTTAARHVGKVAMAKVARVVLANAAKAGMAARRAMIATDHAAMITAPAPNATIVRLTTVVVPLTSHRRAAHGGRGRSRKSRRASSVARPVAARAGVFSAGAPVAVLSNALRVGVPSDPKDALIGHRGKHHGPGPRSLMKKSPIHEQCRDHHVANAA